MPHAKVKLYAAGTLLVTRIVPREYDVIRIYFERFTNVGDLGGGWNSEIKEFQYHLRSLLVLEDCFVELTDEKDTFSWTDSQTNVRVLTGDGREGFAFLHFWQRILTPVV